MTLSSDRLPVFRMPLEPAEEIDEEVQQSQIEIQSLRRAGCQTVALADALLKLAKQYGNRKMLIEMEPLLLEALSIRETELGSHHLSVSLDLKNLGRLRAIRRSRTTFPKSDEHTSSFTGSTASARCRYC